MYTILIRVCFYHSIRVAHSGRTVQVSLAMGVGETAGFFGMALPGGPHAVSAPTAFLRRFWGVSAAFLRRDCLRRDAWIHAHMLAAVLRACSQPALDRLALTTPAGSPVAPAVSSGRFCERFSAAAGAGLGRAGAGVPLPPERLALREPRRDRLGADTCSPACPFCSTRVIAPRSLD